MDFADRIDRLTLDALEATGATKWAARDGSIGAFVAEMDYGIAEPIKQALHAAVDEGGFGYLPASRAADLRMATSEMLQSRHGWAVAPSDVRPVPDVVKALELAIHHHSRPNSKVIVPTPAYMPFLSIPPKLGREVIEVPMQPGGEVDGLDLDAIGQAFEDGGNLLVLCNPCNPLGRVFSRDELTRLGNLVERHGGRVFADEIWAPLVFPGNSYTPYASVNAVTAGHAITAISASKAWNLPGLKCAQVVTSNERDRDIWERIGFLAGHGTSNLGVVANIAAYRSGFPWLSDVLAYLDRNRRALAALVAEMLPGVRYRVPEGTYIAWLDFRETSLAHRPAAFFKQHARVHLTDGSTCGHGFEDCARFIFATPLPIMEMAVTRMSEAVKSGKVLEHV